MALLNVRSAHRAVAGAGPGAEGNVTKLVLSENGHEAAAILVALNAPETTFLDGPGGDGRLPGAHAPGDVDRRRHLGDQAEPDRRAHPRPAPGSIDQLTDPAGPSAVRFELSLT